jgi:hypothetical protein
MDAEWAIPLADSGSKLGADRRMLFNDRFDVMITPDCNVDGNRLNPRTSVLSVLYRRGTKGAK